MNKILLFVFGSIGLSLNIEISAAKGIVCKDYDGNPMTVKPKTITIFNNSEVTIYPVLATSKNAVNEWIQGCFRTTESYPTNYVYKLYVNEGTGIVPGSSVKITLPLYSQLANDRYITWWNGGRIVLADKNERLRNENDQALSTPEDVSCDGTNTECKLSVYSSDVQFPENIYAQLSEYTFGDSIIPPKQSTRILKPENVGYNISYVDHVYMPVAIGPKNNPYIGYSGSVMSLPTFRSHLNSFLETNLGHGWPVYNLNELKLPGGYNVFAQRSGTLPPGDNVPVKPNDGFPPVLTVLACIQGDCTEEQKASLHFGESVQRMQNLWGSCVNWDEEDISKYITQKVDCPQDLKGKLSAVQQFFKKNHQQYLQLYEHGKCNLTPGIDPVPFNYWEAIKHIYGWVPFNEGCGAGANPLAETNIPGWDHAGIQSMYIYDLQYNYQNKPIPELLFNPYVQLIHDKNYLSMDAYGFSVDDAVGFMSELGDGLIFTVGGTKGLENQQEFNYADGFSVAIGVPLSLLDQVNTPMIKKYGVCVFNQDANDLNCQEVKQNVIMPTNSQIAGFRVGTVASYPIKVFFTDLNDNLYTFVVNTKFAPCSAEMDPSQCPTNKAEIIDTKSCIVTKSNGEKHPKSNNWCQNANPNQQREKQLTKNFISFPPPVDYME
ncbi:TPA: hypothetical protein KKX56_002468 [Legionella pneumophila]|nr:hypothetical protein [Legionella pneumophila]